MQPDEQPALISADKAYDTRIHEADVMRDRVIFNETDMITTGQIDTKDFPKLSEVDERTIETITIYY